MRLPEFTAEASLYKTSESYRLVAEEMIITEGQAIIPQCVYCPSGPSSCMSYMPGAWICVNGVAYICKTDGSWQPFSTCFA